MKKIFDGHCHLDSKSGDCATALAELRREAEANGVAGILLLNIPGPQFGGVVGFENEEVIEKASAHGDFFRVFPCVNPLDADAAGRVATYKKLGASGIKLHPRLHIYKVDGDPCVNLLKAVGAEGLPAIICGFPDGLNIALGNTPDAFGRLALSCPETRIAIGHACGHRIIEAMMIAKAFNNIHLDISFSPLYYQGSSVMNDIAYSLKSIKGRKAFWGTDFPDRPYAKTVEMSESVFSNMELSETALDMIFSSNVLSFLNPEP